jgi:2-polyprenyl-6-methoxyphenol hydroxylase-like FAD-dependent oxidoreductase/protein-S-isoprenylcysteine O-methyltransferase Ste14
MYDAIIVGARVAGSATAMLLARQGYRVLLVDRATFPSDTLSTHQIQIPGSLALKRWGLLERVLATEPSPASHARFDLGEVVVAGQYPIVDGIGFVQTPRRYLLDHLLLTAAAEAGTEVREGYQVQDLLWEDGCVVGIRGQGGSGGTTTERARIVVGADGKYSLVAKAVAAPRYDAHPSLTCGYYTYWEGIPLQGNELYRRDRRFMVLAPTNAHLTLIYVAWPTAEFNAFRADVEASYMATIDLIPAVAERVRQGRRVERIAGAGDMPNCYRKPYGPGWALVGDAGYVKDPITGLGISDAFRDAELLADALRAGFTGQQPPDAALAFYERQRNAASKPTYDFTLDTARLRPFRREEIALLEALAHHPTAASQFFGVLTGVVKPADFLAPQNLLRLIGLRDMAKVAGSRVFHPALRRASASTAAVTARGEECTMVALRTLLFSILVPGVVALYFPYLFLQGAHELALPLMFSWPWIGIIPFALGIALYFWCAGEFTFRGRGTPAPIDPPRALVIKGPYRWTRNPMYVAVLSTILGEALLFRSAALAIYAVLLFGVFHLFIISYEEPTLQRLFGTAYMEYRHAVPRWLLRWPTRTVQNKH